MITGKTSKIYRNTSTLKYLQKYLYTQYMTFFIENIFLNMNRVHNNTFSLKITTK